MDERSSAPNAHGVQPAAGDVLPPARATVVSAYDYLLLYIGCTSLAIMALIGTYAFSPVRALTFGLLLTIVLAAALLGRYGTPSTSFRDADLCLIGILAVALVLRVNISTNYLGGLDPGFYVAFSRVIEHTGGPYFGDVFRADLPEQLRAIYDRVIMGSNWPVGDGLHYEISYYPLHPGWMAVFSGLFGADAHGLSVLIFSLFGVTGAYFLARELSEGTGVAEGRLAALFTAVNPALCYLAKMPLSEAPATAFLMNAAYLLTKALRVEGRPQNLLFGGSLMLVVAFFFTRLSFPILLVPWLALYICSRCSRLDATTARRLRGYLWLVAAALVVALVVYHSMVPGLFAGILDVYRSLLGRHPYLSTAVAVTAVVVLAAIATPLHSRLAFPLNYVARTSERVAPWLPAVLVLAGVPGMVELARNGMLFFPGQAVSIVQLTPEPTAFRYHLLYRLILALTPFLLAALIALPWLARNERRLTIPLLFLGGAWAFTQAFTPTLPYLYYHIRFVASELVPFSLVVVAVVLAAMARSPGHGRRLAIAVGLAAAAAMGFFSAVQLAGREGEDARFFHEIDARVSDRDVMVVTERETGDRVTLALRYYFEKKLFILPRDATLSETTDVIRYLLENAQIHHGRLLILSPSPALPFHTTLQAQLQIKESGISNTENPRFDPPQSKSAKRMFLPTVWRSNTQTFYLYRVDAVASDLDSFGCSIDFSSWGNSWSHTVSGWGGQEGVSRWTVGSQAVLRMKLAPGSGDLRRMKLRAAGFAPGGKAQRVQILVDAKKVAELAIDGSSQDYNMDLAASIGPGEHEIIFRLPDARSPRSAGVGDDSRVLGIAIVSLSFMSSDGSSGPCE
jgi:hypothetical protein